VAKDRQIVEAACELESVIVTGNRRDFEREILRFQRLTKRKDCHELWGLIVLPNGLLRQKRVLKYAEKRLRFQGKALRWGDVWRGNYYVPDNARRTTPSDEKVPAMLLLRQAGLKENRHDSPPRLRARPGRVVSDDSTGPTRYGPKPWRAGLHRCKCPNFTVETIESFDEALACQNSLRQHLE
jgi:hypothetical protein